MKIKESIKRFIRYYERHVFVRSLITQWLEEEAKTEKKRRLLLDELGLEPEIIG